MNSDSDPVIDPKILENPIFKQLVAEGLRIQHCFLPEPVYARTGKGNLKSEGVGELQRIKKMQSRDRG